jgi:hypothetical protein
MADKKYIGEPGKQDDPCWKGYEMVGMKKKGGRKVPNCVPEATDIIAKAKAAVAKKAGAKLKLDPDTGTPDHFTAAARRKKGLPEENDQWRGGTRARGYGKSKETSNRKDVGRYTSSRRDHPKDVTGGKLAAARLRMMRGEWPSLGESKIYSVHVKTYDSQGNKQMNSPEFKKHVSAHGGEVDYVSDKGAAFKFKSASNAAMFHRGVQSKFKELDSEHDMHEEADSKKYPRKGFPEPGDYGYHPNPGLKPQESDSDEDMDVAYKKATEKEGRKPLNAKVLEIEEKRGLWDNIHAKRKRIKSGSGERMRKPGSEGAPSAADLKASQTEAVAPMPRTLPQSRYAGKANDTLDNSFAKRNQAAIDKRNDSIKRSAEARRRMLHPDTAERKREKRSFSQGGYSTSDRYKSVKEELGKSNEWGTDALRKKYAAMTPGQESMAADKIPSFDPRYDNVTTQYCGGIREGYLAEISARGAEARAKFQTKVRQTLADPANIKRAKKTLAKRKEAEKAKEPAHLVMQLRKAVSIGSKVHFQDGSHHAITGNHADIFMSKYNSAKSSIEKEALQKRAHKSHSEFMRTIAEEAHENCGTPDCCQMCDTAEMGTHHVDSYEAHRGSGDQISPVISHDDEDIRFQDFDETAFEKELEADVLSLSWDDMVDLYDEDEIEYDDSPEEEGEDLEEGITPAGRLKKRFNAMRSKSRRMMARNIAIKRVSSPEKLKSRSIRAARRMVYKRLLRNRDISTVSSSEKTRLEAQIKRMAPMVARLSVRVMPAVRKLEQSRIKNSRMRKRK